VERAHGSLTCLHRLKLAAFWAIREFQRFQAVLQKFFQIFPPKSWVETHADASGRWMRIFSAGSPVFLPLTDKWVLIKKVILENRCFLLKLSNVAAQKTAAGSQVVESSAVLHHPQHPGASGTVFSGEFQSYFPKFSS
jgi:hypothetical protein